MTSHEPAQCCTVGVKHEGTAKGELKTIDGTEFYIATPSRPHASIGILICPDVIGHRFINAQLIADQFAANGYLVVMPDLFHGDPIPLNRPEGFDLQKWLYGSAKGGEGPGHTVARVEPVVKDAIKYMKTELGVKRIGAVGYCFGAKYVVRGLGDGDIDVGYVAHPSFVDEAELQKMKGPLSIAAAETDGIFPAEKRHASEAILKELGTPYQIYLYGGVEHGFAVKADLSTKVAKFAKEQAFYQAVQWFDTWLKE